MLGEITCKVSIYDNVEPYTEVYVKYNIKFDCKHCDDVKNILKVNIDSISHPVEDTISTLYRYFVEIMHNNDYDALINCSIKIDDLSFGATPFNIIFSKIYRIDQSEIIFGSKGIKYTLNNIPKMIRSYKLMDNIIKSCKEKGMFGLYNEPEQLNLFEE